MSDSLGFFYNDQVSFFFSDDRIRGKRLFFLMLEGGLDSEG